MQITTLEKLNRRRARVRAKIIGTPERPRLSVRISLRNVTIQIIDDTAGKTLAAVTTAGTDVKGNMTDKAVWAGQQIADRAKAKKIKQVAFDRGGRKYHGRLAALAEAAREKGLEF